MIMHGGGGELIQGKFFIAKVAEQMPKLKNSSPIPILLILRLDLHWVV